jgi:hypothetical protein
VWQRWTEAIIALPPFEWVLLAVTAFLLWAVLFPVFQQAHSYSGPSPFSNVKQLNTALLMYAQDHNGQFPPMNSAIRAQAALAPYVRGNERAWHNFERRRYEPGRRRLLFHVNPFLSGKRRAQFSPAEQRTMVTFYGRALGRNAPSGRYVGFLDGRTRFVPTEAEWRRLKAASHIPPLTASQRLVSGEP